jgi:LacI family transcriptional regulator
MKPPIGIKDIAQHAGVSTGPVDKVLNNRGGVSKATRERIMKAIDELGYTPNILASRLKSAKQFVIAVLIPSTTREIPYWQEHQKGFLDAIEELKPYGFSIELHHFHQNDKEEFIRQTALILNKKYDGVFMVPVFTEATAHFVNQLKQRQIPIIFFDTQLPELPTIPFIGQHSYDSGYLAAELLSKTLSPTGAVLIVCLTQEHDNHLHFISRENGFREFFNGRQTAISKYESSPDNTAIELELSALIKANPSIEGVFVTNGIDRIAPIFGGSSAYTLIGYDLIRKNVDYLKKGLIDFLISQRPYTQAHAGIRLFYDLLLLKKTVRKKNYLPIDIVMKSNLKYYSDLLS